MIPLRRLAEIGPVLALLILGAAAPVAAATPATITSTAAAQSARPLVIHVKTSMRIDDAQICVVPNIAWAALAQGRPVRVVFDGSAVTSVTRGYGWRGWVGIDSTAMDRAKLPERERRALAKTFAVPLETVPRDYGAYLHFIGEKGAELYYNETMALLYKIDPKRIDPALKPLGLKKLLAVLETPGDYLVY